MLQVDQTAASESSDGTQTEVKTMKSHAQRLWCCKRMRACYRYCSTSCLDGRAKQNRFESDTHITDTRYWLRGMAGCGTEIRGSINLHGGYIHRSFTAAVQFGRSKSGLPVSLLWLRTTSHKSQDGATGSTASAACGIADSMIHDVWWKSGGKPRIMHQSPRPGGPARGSVLPRDLKRTRRVSSEAFESESWAALRLSRRE